MIIGSVILYLPTMEKSSTVGVSEVYGYPVVFVVTGAERFLVKVTCKILSICGTSSFIQDLAKTAAIQTCPIF